MHVNEFITRWSASGGSEIANFQSFAHDLCELLEVEGAADNLIDGSIIGICLEDAEFLAILASRIHVTWTLAQGGTLEDRPRYNKSRCFDPFPFPDLTPTQCTTLRQLGEELDAHRKERQA